MELFNAIIVLMAIILVFIVLVGFVFFILVSNLTILWTVIQNRSLRRPSNYGVLAISILNLLLTANDLIAIVLKISHPHCRMRKEYADQPEIWCYIGGFMDYTCNVLLMLVPVSVAVDRYIAICHPFVYLRRSKSGGTKWIFFACFMLACLLGACLAIVNRYPTVDTLEDYFAFEQILWISPLPILIDLVLYIKIFIALKRSVSIPRVLRAVHK